MTTGEVRKRLPGLKKDTLDYWKRKGWIVPKIQGTRYHYTEADFRLIGRLWHYYQEGLRHEKAYERACADLKIKPRD